MSRSVKIAGAIIAAFIVIVVAVFISARTSSTDQGAANPTSQTGHVMGTPGAGKVTLVEFMDFECEGCRAAYPLVEQLRTEYKGKVTFVARYFPMPGHFNGETAAIAVEAAARQGKFEPMYKKMFDTQSQWGEQRVSAAPLFRQYAQELGLNMAQYDADVADPAVLERVKADQQDGVKLGVEGTPTFFLNGEKITPQSEAEIRALIDAALKQ